MEGNIIQLKEYHLNKGASKDHTPVFPMTKASAIEGMAELLKDLKISGVTPANSISDVSSPEKGKIYYEESTDKYYVYNEAQSNFVELGAGASVDPSDLTPTVTQTTFSEQSGGDNIITFTFPNGETTQVIIKNGAQGAQGNSGYTGAVGELEVVNNLEDGGEEKALSAEMGKELKTQAFVEKGTFGDAYDKAKEHIDVSFPWLLDDVDDKGNAVNKMIWHIGDGIFVDAIGATITGPLNGLTITTNANGKVKLFATADDAYNGRRPSVTKDLISGKNNFSFDELGGSTHYTIMFYDTDGTTLNKQIVTEVDFGGMKLKETSEMFKGNTSIVSIKRVVVDNPSSWNNFTQDSTNIKELQLSGTFNSNANGDNKIVTRLNNLETIDVKNLHGFFDINNCPKVTYLDIRNMITSHRTTLKSLLYGTTSLNTLIIGDFDTSSITALDNFCLNKDNNSLPYLVCTAAIPPATNANGLGLTRLLNVASAILIPPGNVEIDGTTMSILDAYKSADVWTDFSPKMSVYSEGEY